LIVVVGIDIIIIDEQTLKQEGESRMMIAAALLLVFLLGLLIGVMAGQISVWKGLRRRRRVELPHFNVPRREEETWIYTAMMKEKI